MKHKALTIALVAAIGAVLVVPRQAHAGDSEWATAGKILAGVTALQFLTSLGDGHRSHHTYSHETRHVYRERHREVYCEREYDPDPEPERHYYRHRDRHYRYRELDRHVDPEVDVDYLAERRAYGHHLRRETFSVHCEGVRRYH